MKLFLFRLSLKRKHQADAFERRNLDGREFNREEWLRDRFSKQFSFAHQGNQFFFVPEDAQKVGLPSNLIVGWVARDKPLAERTPPWEGLSPTRHASWQASLLLLDPTEHSDGQKLAFEQRKNIGGANAVVSSLAAELSRFGPSEPFTVEVFPIIQERSFERFVSEHKGRITTITYDVAVPNMFNGPDDFSNELRDLRDNGNVSRIRTTIESDGAINTDKTQLDEIATHVEKGGGKITAKTKDGVRYHSDDYARSENVDTSGSGETTPSFWQRVAAALDRVF